MDPANKKTGAKSLFHRFACWTAQMSGRPWAFMLAVSVIGGWAIIGPLAAKIAVCISRETFLLTEILLLV
jgi:low affinity Fe/Cu permease